jgi:hypothetical protein
MTKFIKILVVFLVIGGDGIAQSVYSVASPRENLSGIYTKSKIGNSKIRGGVIIKGYTGVVEINSSCTGNIIAPNAILTAAHCLGGVGVATSAQGSGNFSIDYFDPISGRRQVYNDVADWYVPENYRHNGNRNVGWANKDIAVIVTRGELSNTNTSDYLVLYDDDGGYLKPTLMAYGAGIYTYSGKNDNNLRVNWFEVEHVKKNHIVIDTRKKDGICQGDSGGPLIYERFVPMVAGVASLSELFGLEEEACQNSDGNKVSCCTNNDWGIDDAIYSRTNWSKFSPLMERANLNCTRHDARGVSYRKCFSETTPRIVLSTTHIGFGSVPQKDIRTRKLKIFNYGLTNLSISIAPSSPAAGQPKSGFIWRPLSILIPPDQSRDVIVEFLPRANGKFEGTLSISSNSVGSPHIVKLSGTGSDNNPRQPL